MENSYNIEKLRSDDNIVISQDDLYSIAWEAESNSSLLDCPTVYRDLVTNEHTNSQNSVTQQNNDEHSSQRSNDASDFVNDELHSNKHSSQDHVNTPKNDLRDDIEVRNEKDGT